VKRGTRNSERGTENEDQETHRLIRSTKGNMATTDESRYLKPRTKQFALRAVRLVESLPKNLAAQVIGKQLLRSALSVGANYRSAKRARSNAEFISKMGIVEEEADESRYWLEMLVDAGLISKERLQPLIAETNEITAMVVASIRTARKHKNNL
jgi:four helix bundle protein